jgi:hypothetical protein
VPMTTATDATTEAAPVVPDQVCQSALIDHLSLASSMEWGMVNVAYRAFLNGL